MTDGNLELALRIRADLKEVRRELKALRGGVDTASEGMARMQNRTRQLTAGLGQAVAAFASFAALTRAARDVAGFEASLSKIVGLVGLSRQEVEGMGKEILALAPKVATGPGELAEALFFVTSAGARGAEALNILKLSAQAATAGLGDTKTVADAVTSAINAYGSVNLDAGKATGILVAAVREGKAGAETIAPALGRLLPIAAELGVSFDQVAGSVAFFTRSGLNASEAATALRGLLVQILRPAKEAQSAAAKLGFDFSSLRRTLNENGLLAALNQLQDAVGDNRVAFARLFPDIEGLTGLLSLLGKDAETAQQILESLAEAGNHTVVNAFGAGAQDTLRRYKNAMVAFDVAVIRLGAEGLPILAKALESVAAHLDSIIAVITAFLGLRLARAVGDSVVALNAMARSATAAGGAMRGLNVALRASPVGLVASGVAALAGGLALLATHSSQAAAAQRDLAEGIETVNAAGLAQQTTRIERILHRRRADLAILERQSRQSGHQGRNARQRLEALRSEVALAEAALETQRADLETQRAKTAAALALAEERLAGLAGHQSRNFEQQVKRLRGQIQALDRDLAILNAREATSSGLNKDAQRQGDTPPPKPEDEAAAKAIAQLERERDLYGELSREEALRYEIQKGRLQTATQGQRIVLLGLARELDQLDAVAKQEQKTAHRHKQAIADIKAASRALAGPYEQAIIEITNWQQTTREALDRNAEGWAQYTAEIDRIAKERRDRADKEEADRELKESRRWQDGARRGLQDYVKEATDAASHIEQATRRGFAGMEEALTNFVTTGKLNFTSLANSILSDLARIAIRQSITGPLAGAIGSLFGAGAIGGNTASSSQLLTGGGFDTAFKAAFSHSGGIAGTPGGVSRALPPDLFSAAPRFHAGGIAGRLKPNEIPTILEKGEGVFTREQMAALGGPRQVKVTLVNQGTPQRVVDSDTRFDPRGLIMQILTEDIRNHGPISGSMEGTYGLRRRVG